MINKKSLKPSKIKNPPVKRGFFDEVPTHRKLKESDFVTPEQEQEIENRKIYYYLRRTELIAE